MLDGKQPENVLIGEERVQGRVQGRFASETPSRTLEGLERLAGAAHDHDLDRGAFCDYAVTGRHNGRLTGVWNTNMWFRRDGSADLGQTTGRQRPGFQSGAPPPQPHAHQPATNRPSPRLPHSSAIARGAPRHQSRDHPRCLPFVIAAPTLPPAERLHKK